MSDQPNQMDKNNKTSQQSLLHFKPKGGKAWRKAPVSGLRQASSMIRILLKEGYTVKFRTDKAITNARARETRTQRSAALRLEDSNPVKH